MVINKVGAEKYYIIISLILGLMVLSISLYFIFYEYFTGEDLDYQACRQSILLRANLPEYKVGPLNLRLISFKDDFPLKCKTDVIEIGEDDVGETEDIIANKMAECWALYGNGDMNAFPSDVYGQKSICVSCARIHLTEEAKKKIKDEEITLNIREALDLRMDNKDYSYWTYLNNSGKKFPALNPASSGIFKIEGDVFRIDSWGQKSIELLNRLNGEKIYSSKVEASRTNLPEKFLIDKGDLLINYGVLTSSESSDFGDYIPYLFFFQQGQEEPNPFDEFNKDFFDEKGNFWHSVNFCESWEGIPA